MIPAPTIDDTKPARSLQIDCVAVREIRIRAFFRHPEAKPRILHRDSSLRQPSLRVCEDFGFRDNEGALGFESMARSVGSVGQA